MILCAGMTDRLPEVDAPLPERPSHDRARSARAAQPLQILKRRDAPRRLDGQVRKPADGLVQQVDIRAGHHPVPPDVGHEQMARLRLKSSYVPEAGRPRLGPAHAGDVRHPNNDLDVERACDAPPDDVPHSLIDTLRVGAHVAADANTLQAYERLRSVPT